MGANSCICKLCICYKIIKYLRLLLIQLIAVCLSAVRTQDHNNGCGSLPLKILDTHGKKCVHISSVGEFYVYVYGSLHRCLLIIVQRDATQSSLFIILQVHSTCFRCQPHPSPGVHETVTTASATGHTGHTSLQRGQASLATLEGGSCTNNMISTGGCSYSFVYSC